jgi:exodeoxyribonuclease VII small subunit
MTSTALPSGIGLTPLEDLSFEQAFEELQGIVSALESEESSLEEALALYERGQGLVRFCTGLLDKAELKVQQLSGKELVDLNPEL